MRRMRLACRTQQVTSTLSEYAILIPFQRNNGYANVPQYCVLRTFPLLFNIFIVLQGNVKKKFTFLCNCIICNFILGGSLGVFRYDMYWTLQ